MDRRDFDLCRRAAGGADETEYHQCGGATLMSRGAILMLIFFVLCNTGGEIAMSYGMKRVGEPQGFRPMALWRFVWAAARNRRLWVAIPLLAASFYSLLILFSWAPVSVVIPAS